jgi:nucleoid-associated protein YgaU
MRRLVLAVLGFNLLATGMAQAAEPPVSPLWQPTGQVATTPAQLPAQPPALNPLWQPQAPLVSPGPLARPESRSIFDRSAGGDPTARTGTGVDPTAGAVAGTVPPSGAPTGTRPVIGPGADVVVRTGDSLWTLAAEQLGPLATDLEIAEQWPRWFQANRGVIGDDPSLLLPGQILRAP